MTHTCGTCGYPAGCIVFGLACTGGVAARLPNTGGVPGTPGFCLTGGVPGTPWFGLTGGVPGIPAGFLTGGVPGTTALLAATGGVLAEPGLLCRFGRFITCFVGVLSVLLSPV